MITFNIDQTVIESSMSFCRTKPVNKNVLSIERQQMKNEMKLETRVINCMKCTYNIVHVGNFTPGVTSRLKYFELQRQKYTAYQKSGLLL